MTYTDENAEQRAAFLESLGIKYSASFVPQSQSRNRKDKTPSLNWRVELERHGVHLETDYMQGIGHVPGSMQVGGYDRRVLLGDVNETGTYHPGASSFRTKKVVAPAMEDVLSCLVSDASACRMTFDEWCGEFGYDTDSRKAHATYMECAQQGLVLTRLLGGNEAFQKLEDLFAGF